MINKAKDPGSPNAITTPESNMQWMQQPLGIQPSLLTELQLIFSKTDFFVHPFCFVILGS